MVLGFFTDLFSDFAGKVLGTTIGKAFILTHFLVMKGIGWAEFGLAKMYYTHVISHFFDPNFAAPNIYPNIDAGGEEQVLSVALDFNQMLLTDIVFPLILIVALLASALYLVGHWYRIREAVLDWSPKFIFVVILTYTSKIWMDIILDFARGMLMTIQPALSFTFLDPLNMYNRMNSSGMIDSFHKYGAQFGTNALFMILGFVFLSLAFIVILTLSVRLALVYFGICVMPLTTFMCGVPYLEKAGKKFNHMWIQNCFAIFFMAIPLYLLQFANGVWSTLGLLVITIGAPYLYQAGHVWAMKSAGFPSAGGSARGALSTGVAVAMLNTSLRSSFAITRGGLQALRGGLRGAYVKKFNPMSTTVTAHHYNRSSFQDAYRNLNPFGKESSNISKPEPTTIGKILGVQYRSKPDVQKGMFGIGAGILHGLGGGLTKGRFGRKTVDRYVHGSKGKVPRPLDIDVEHKVAEYSQLPDNFDFNFKKPNKQSVRITGALFKTLKQDPNVSVKDIDDVMVDDGGKLVLPPTDLRDVKKDGSDEKIEPTFSETFQALHSRVKKEGYKAWGRLEWPESKGFTGDKFEGDTFSNESRTSPNDIISLYDNAPLKGEIPQPEETDGFVMHLDRSPMIGSSGSTSDGYAPRKISKKMAWLSSTLINTLRNEEGMNRREINNVLKGIGGVKLKEDGKLSVPLNPDKFRAMNAVLLNEIHSHGYENYRELRWTKEPDKGMDKTLDELQDYGNKTQ